MNTVLYRLDAGSVDEDFPNGRFLADAAISVSAVIFAGSTWL